jgi:hypothetical protein
MCYKDLTGRNMDAEVLEDVCNVIYTHQVTVSLRNSVLTS